jgi:two-component system, OmpR family, alkaline phosphatase synthesis response regulator PhoP
MTAPGADKQTALVVEDDDQVAYLIQFILEQDGFRVQRAANGRAAQLIIAGMAPPALVTLDITLPQVQGDELILQIRSQPGWEQVPVLMVTAKPKDRDMAWAIKSGAQGYIVKPFKPEQLREQVRKLVARKPGD